MRRNAPGNDLALLRLCASLEGKEKEKAGLFEVPLFVLMTIVSGPYCFGEVDPAAAISMLAT